MRNHTLKLLSVILIVLVGASLLPAKDSKSTTLQVKGMTCQDCEVKVATELKKLDGITEVEVDYASGQAVVQYAADEVSMDDMKKAVVLAGFEIEKKSIFSRKKKSSCSGASGGCATKCNTSL